MSWRGTRGVDRLRDKVGLPLSTYFSGPRITWLLDNVDGARKRAENGELAFGTMDTWVLWNLTGGTNGGQHVTDVTNASRTMLMDVETLEWHEPAARADGHPEVDAAGDPLLERALRRGGGLRGRRPADLGHLGDQHVALFGQTCFEAGDAKNTYGTGSFLLVNTGEEVVRTDKLLTSVCYKLGDQPAKYVREGVDRRHGRAHPVAARPDGDHRQRRGGRGAGQDRRRQRRRVLRAGVLRPVRAMTRGA